MDLGRQTLATRYDAAPCQSMHSDNAPNQCTPCQYSLLTHTISCEYALLIHINIPCITHLLTTSWLLDLLLSSLISSSRSLRHPRRINQSTGAWATLDRAPHPPLQDPQQHRHRGDGGSAREGKEYGLVQGDVENVGGDDGTI